MKLTWLNRGEDAWVSRYADGVFQLRKWENSYRLTIHPHDGFSMELGVWSRLELAHTTAELVLQQSYSDLELLAFFAHDGSE